MILEGGRRWETECTLPPISYLLNSSSGVRRGDRAPLDVASHARPLDLLDRPSRKERVEGGAHGRGIWLLRQMRRGKQRVQATGRPRLVNLSAVDERALPIVEKAFGRTRGTKRARDPLALVVQKRTGQLHRVCQTLQAFARIL